MPGRTSARLVAVVIAPAPLAFCRQGAQESSQRRAPKHRYIGAMRTSQAAKPDRSAARPDWSCSTIHAAQRRVCMQ